MIPLTALFFRDICTLVIMGVKDSFWIFFSFFILLIAVSCQISDQPDEAHVSVDSLPNIVFILADDLGYGDIGIYNPESKIPTPFLDRLAQEGKRFTDAHSGSGVCTPTRYGLLTGRYSWRTWLKQGVLWPPDDKPLIDPERLTVAGLLKQAGYHTACIGKWHLGFDWGRDDRGEVDFNRALRYGPTDVGFDEFFGIAGSLDMIPYVFYHNRIRLKRSQRSRQDCPFHVLSAKAPGPNTSILGRL